MYQMLKENVLSPYSTDAVTPSDRLWLHQSSCATGDRKGAAVIKPHRTTGSGNLGALLVNILIAFLSINE